MIPDRRSFLKGLTLTSSAGVLSPMLGRLSAEAAGVARNKMPKRFVFVMKSSGIIPERLEPDSLKPKIADKGQYVNESLVEHKLPETLAPLEPFKDQCAILQGLSGKMCKGGHSSWFGALGVYKTGGEHNSGSILRATVDAVLAKLNPSPFNHVDSRFAEKLWVRKQKGHFTLESPQWRQIGNCRFRQARTSPTSSCLEVRSAVIQMLKPAIVCRPGCWTSWLMTFSV